MEKLGPNGLNGYEKIFYGNNVLAFDFELFIGGRREIRKDWYLFQPVSCCLCETNLVNGYSGIARRQSFPLICLRSGRIITLMVE